MPIKHIDLDGAEPANNPRAPGSYEKAAIATVGSIRIGAKENNITENLFSERLWTNEELLGSFSGTSTGSYIADNTDMAPANRLNLFVSNQINFKVNESNASKFNNYEAFVVSTLMDNFSSGMGPENYEFSTNGIISSKFLKSDIFNAALNDYKSGELPPNVKIWGKIILEGVVYIR